MRRPPDPRRWAISRVVVVDGTITTAASRDRVARVVANYFAPFVGGRPALPWALVELVGVVPTIRWGWRTGETRILPFLSPSSPLARLSLAERVALRALLEDALGDYAAPAWDGSTVTRAPFAGVALRAATEYRAALRRVFDHLGHSTARPRLALAESHNTAWTDDFATDTAASWSPWASSTWTHDAVNGERSVAWGSSGGPKGFRYSAHNSGSLAHEAQVSGHLIAPFRTRLGLPAVRMASAQRDAYAVNIHTRFPSIDLDRIVNGVTANLLNVFGEPAGFAIDSEEWVTLRLSAAGAVGANVVLNLWARTEATTAKPADPGWVGVDATPGWTVTDTAANRLDDAVHTDCGIVNAVDGGSSNEDAKYDYFKLRAIADRGGVVDTTLAGAAAGAAAASGALTTAIRLAGAASGSALAAASLATAIRFAGAAAGVGLLAASLVTAIPLAGVAAGGATATGALETGITLAGAAAGGSTASADLLTDDTLAGEAVGGSLAVGDLTTAITFAGVAQGGSSATAMLVAAGTLAGHAVGAATAVGDLATAIPLAGVADGGSLAVGELATAITLRGAAVGVATATGNLTASPTRPVEGGVRWPKSMADVSLVELVETQAIAWLRDDPGLTTLVNRRIYTTIPDEVVYPYVLLEAFIVSPWNRLRGFGRAVVFQARAQSQVKGDYEVHRIADRMTWVLEGRDVALPPAKRSLWSIDETPGPTYTDVAAGVVTFHRPVSVRVRVAV